MDSNIDISVAKCSVKRLKSELRVYFGPSQQTILSGFSIDLSSGGLYLKTEFPLKVDEQVSLIFSLPGQKKSVACQARIAWVNPEGCSRKNDFPPGVGLQFIELSLEHVLAISRFIENYEMKAAW